MNNLAWATFAGIMSVFNIASFLALWIAERYIGASLFMVLSIALLWCSLVFFDQYLKRRNNATA